jgi:hypothetical protein
MDIKKLTLSIVISLPFFSLFGMEPLEMKKEEQIVTEQDYERALKKVMKPCPCNLFKYVTVPLMGISIALPLAQKFLVFFYEHEKLD